MNIRIANGWGQIGELMTLYRDNVEILSVECADGCPETLLDYLSEFDITPERLDITLEQAYANPTQENEQNVIWIIR